MKRYKNNTELKLEKSFKTENGINIYSYQNPKISSFAISLYVRYGLIYESADLNGFAHFFEHAVFRNINALMGGELYKTLDLNGLTFNASTSVDCIEFSISGAEKHFETAAKLISYVLSPFVLSAKELEPEKKRIKAEIREECAECLGTFSDRLTFAGTPLERPITGKCGDIDRYGIKLLQKLRGFILSPENIFFYVAGKHSDVSIKKLAKFAEGFVLEAHPYRNGAMPLPTDFGARNCTVKLRNASSVSVIVTFDIPKSDYNIPEKYCLYDILFNGETSPFHTELSENRGLIYSFKGNMAIYESFDQISLEYDVRADNLIKSLKLVLGIFASAADIADERMPYVRPIYTENSAAVADDPEWCASWFGFTNHILHSGMSNADERASAFAEVSAKRVSELAKTVFNTNNLVIALNGSKKKTDASEIRRLALEILS